MLPSRCIVDIYRSRSSTEPTSVWAPPIGPWWNRSSDLAGYPPCASSYPRWWCRCSTPYTPYQPTSSWGYWSLIPSSSHWIYRGCTRYLRWPTSPTYNLNPLWWPCRWSDRRTTYSVHTASIDAHHPPKWSTLWGEILPTTNIVDSGNDLILAQNASLWSHHNTRRHRFGYLASPMSVSRGC